MATHDYSIANQSFPATRSDLNNALTAIKSSNSASAAPTASLVPGQLFYDTANNVLKVYTGSAFQELLSGQIVAADIAANAVETAKIASSAVTTAKIASDNVNADKLAVTGNGASGQILTSDADGTFSWATLTAGTGLDLSGTTFSLETDLRDGITHIGRDANDCMHIDTTLFRWFLDGNEDMRLVNNGDLHADGDVIAYSTTISDERLKTGIMPITDALSKVNQLNGCTFTYTADGKKSAGLIAQDVEKVLPSAVSEKELPLKIDDGEKYKVLQYDQTIGLLVEAIKELKDIVEKQAIEIKALQGA